MTQKRIFRFFQSTTKQTTFFSSFYFLLFVRKKNGGKSEENYNNKLRTQNKFNLVSQITKLIFSPLNLSAFEARKVFVGYECQKCKKKSLKKQKQRRHKQTEKQLRRFNKVTHYQDFGVLCCFPQWISRQNSALQEVIKTALSKRDNKDKTECE